MRRSGGFTLVEMLVGLALLGLVVLALFSAMRIGIQSWERAELKAQQLVDLRIVEGVLRREVARTFPFRIGQANENRIAFEGTGKSVHFMTALPAHFTAGGLSRVVLESAALESDAGGAARGALVLRHAIQDGVERGLAELDDAQQTVLLAGVDSVEFAFFGQDSDLVEPTWRSEWSQAGQLPLLLKLTFRFAEQADTREIILPLRLGEEAGCLQASFQRQCGPRKP